MLSLRARRVRKEVGGWSPFARNDGDCDAVAQALLTAIEHEGRRLVYTGDTGPSEAVAELAGKADRVLVGDPAQGTRALPRGSPGAHASAGAHAPIPSMFSSVHTHLFRYCDAPAFL